MASRATTTRFLAELQRVAGSEAVEALSGACGGLRIYIPRHRLRCADSSLARAFGGVEEANAIIAKLNEVGIHSTRISLPVSRKRLRSVKSRARDALLAGRSVADVASEVGVSERTVFSYRRELVAERRLSRREP